MPKRKGNKKNTNQIVKSKLKAFIAWFDKPWKVFSGIALVITFSITIYEKLIKTDHQKYEEENRITGKIEPPKLPDYRVLENMPTFNNNGNTYDFPFVKGVHIKNLRKYPQTAMQIGGHVFMCQTDDLYKGVEFFNPYYKDCINSQLELAAKGENLYVSTRFIDIETGNEIGEMDFNHWVLYKETFLDYNEDDKRFEVKDKKGNIVFSITFDTESKFPFITIAGYFVDLNSVLILNNEEYFAPAHKYIDDHNHECISKSNLNWQQDAQREIGKIKSIFLRSATN